jgi:hypothetical protein
VGVWPLTLGGLLTHLAVVEDHVVATHFSGRPVGVPRNFGVPRDDSERDCEDWPFTSDAHDRPEQLYAVSTPDGLHVSPRRSACDRGRRCDVGHRRPDGRMST